MKLQTRLAVLVCKASGAVLRKLGRGGTNLPGKLALKIDKNILGELSRGVKVTVVTGTNGKTTTSRMIEQAFADAGLKYFSNKSGANLLTGIIAVFAQHATLSGKCPYTHALIECDEAAFRKTSEYLPVECLVVNNIFRDQLDRYGEITHTLNAIREGITHVPDATLCLNADCSLTASLAGSVPNKIVWFGVNVPIYKETAHELSDAPYCIHCKTEYEYITSPTVISAASAARSAATTARHRRSLSPRYSPPARTRPTSYWTSSVTSTRYTSTCRAATTSTTPPQRPLSRMLSALRSRPRSARFLSLSAASAVPSSSNSVRHRRA